VLPPRIATNLIYWRPRSSGWRRRRQIETNHNYSGAQGAAVGAAVANNNQAQYSAAQGVAVGAALANSNQPQYSAIPGAADATVSDNNQPQYSGAAGTVGGLRNARQ